MKTKEGSGDESSTEESYPKRIFTTISHQFANTALTVEESHAPVMEASLVPFILDGETIAMRIWSNGEFVGFKWGEDRFNEWIETGE